MRTSELKRYWDTAWPVLLVLVPGLIGTARAGDDETGWTRPPDLAADALVVLAAAAVAVLRLRPGLAAAGCAAAVGVYLGLGYPTGPILVALPVTAAGVAIACQPRRALWCIGLMGLAVHLAGAVRYAGDPGPRPYLGWLTLTAALVAVPAAVAAAVRVRRESEAGLRRAHALRAVSEERLRMAQELHDSVGHGLAVIAMQAGVALHVMERNPVKVRESLTAIQTVSREALHELRVQVGALRGAGDEHHEHRPAPGLADATVLLRRLGAGGLDVALSGDLDAGELPPAVDAAAYRILQEALTNVLRHADATSARVRVARTGGHLVIEVRSVGGPTTAAPAGNGIVGMRERAVALGGRLEAGPDPDGGFVVRAWLPVGGAL